MNAYSPTRRMALPMALATLVLAAAPAAQAQPAPAETIVGRWEADDGSLRLDMYKAGPEFQARFLYGNRALEADNVTLKNDVNNPDPALRARSLRNIVFLTGLRWADGEWSGGSIYDPASGRTYNAKAEIVGGKLNLRGYLGVPALGQTQVMHRIP